MSKSDSKPTSTSSPDTAPNPNDGGNGSPSSKDTTEPGKRRFHGYYPILTPEQVREVRKVYKLVDKLNREQGKKFARRGLSADLAAKYGVSQRAIQHIRTGDRWKRLK